jgi:hypothetical protein
VPFTDGAPAGGMPLGRMVKANCRSLRVEASFPSASLYRVPSAGETGDGAAACEAADRFIAAAQRTPVSTPAN